MFMLPVQARFLKLYKFIWHYNLPTTYSAERVLLLVAMRVVGHLSAMLLFFIAHSQILYFAYCWSAFDCGTVPVWSVVGNDNEYAMRKFQDWIFAWQHLCSARETFQEIATNMGFAMSLQSAVKHLLTAIEMGKIYRPQGKIEMHQWIWAEEEASLCTMRIRTVDCFSEPLSTCTMESHYNTMLTHQELHTLSQQDMQLALKFSGPTDVCGLARSSYKPVQWVHGQLLHYLLRPNLATAAEIELRLQKVYGRYTGEVGGIGKNPPEVPSTGADVGHSVRDDECDDECDDDDGAAAADDDDADDDGADGADDAADDDEEEVEEVTSNPSASSHSSVSESAILHESQTPGGTGVIGVYIHGDEYGDAVILPDSPSHFASNIGAINLDDYIRAVDSKAAELADKGKPVSIVYLCSDHQEEILKSEDYLRDHYPGRSYEFRLLPHTHVVPATGSSSSSKIKDVIQVQLEKRQTHGHEPDNHYLVTEYLADFEILSRADVFISTYAAWYMIVASLRIARYYENADFIKHNTCFLDMRRNEVLICEDQIQSQELWRALVGGYASGTPF